MLLNINLLNPELNVVFKSLIFRFGQVNKDTLCTSAADEKPNNFHPLWIVKQSLKPREIYKILNQ